MVGSVFCACAVTSFSAQQRRTRVVEVNLASSIPSVVQPDDDVVVLTRSMHGAVNEPNQSFANAIVGALNDTKDGMIVVAKIARVVGELSPDKEWIYSDVRADVVETVWSSKAGASPSPLRIKDPTGGEITIGKTSVRTDVVLFELGQTFLIFLRSDDDGSLSPARYPLVVKNGKVFNRGELTHAGHRDPLHDKKLGDVVKALKKSAGVR